MSLSAWSPTIVLLHFWSLDHYQYVSSFCEGTIQDQLIIKIEILSSSSLFRSNQAFYMFVKLVYNPVSCYMWQGLVLSKFQYQKKGYLINSFQPWESFSSQYPIALQLRIISLDGLCMWVLFGAYFILCMYSWEGLPDLLSND